MLCLVLEEGSPYFQTSLYSFYFMTHILSFTLLEVSLLISFPKVNLIFQFTLFYYVIFILEYLFRNNRKLCLLNYFNLTLRLAYSCIPYLFANITNVVIFISSRKTRCIN